MTEFKIDVAFNLPNEGTHDGFYRSMRWGVAYKPAGSKGYVQATIDRAPGYGQYGSGVVKLQGDVEGVKKGDTVSFGIYSSSPMGTSKTIELGRLLHVRYSFLPALDVAPGDTQLRISPFSEKDTTKLLQGIGLTTALFDVNNPTSAALGSDGVPAEFACAVVNVTDPVELSEVKKDESHRYAFTAYLAVETGGLGADGGAPTAYFRSDPEIITGKRGGG